MNSVCSVRRREPTTSHENSTLEGKLKRETFRCSRGRDSPRRLSSGVPRTARRADGPRAPHAKPDPKGAPKRPLAPRLVLSPRCSLALRLQATLPYTHTLQLPACRLRAPHSRGAYGAANRTRRKPFKLRPPPSCFHTTTCSTTPSRSALHLVPTEKHRRQWQHPDISHPDSHDA